MQANDKRSNERFDPDKACKAPDIDPMSEFDLTPLLPAYSFDMDILLSVRIARRTWR
jgi:hypothetical protein